MIGRLYGQDVDLSVCGEDVATHCYKVGDMVIDQYVCLDDGRFFCWNDNAGGWYEPKNKSRLSKLVPLDVRAIPRTSFENQW